MATGDVLLTLTPLQYAEYQSAQAKLAEAERRIAQLTGAMADQAHEIEQILGAALGYPRYCDDPANFPGATEAEGVCVGDHVAESLAAEAAARIAALTAERDRYQFALEQYADPLNWTEYDQWIPSNDGPDLAERALAGSEESEATDAHK